MYSTKHCFIFLDYCDSDVDDNTLPYDEEEEEEKEESTFTEVSDWTKINGFRLSNQYTDVEVVVGGKTYSCHRIILALRSPYFNAMFGGNFTEKSVKQVVLNEVEVKPWEEMLEFMYTGEITITRSNVLRVYKSSNFFCIDGLENKCVEFMKKNPLFIKDLMEIGVLACTLNKKRLLDDISWRLGKGKNFRNCAIRKAFLDFPFELVLGMVKNCNKTKADIVVERIVKWVKADEQERNEHLEDLLKLVKLKKVSPDVMKKFVPKDVAKKLRKVVEN